METKIANFNQRLSYALKIKDVTQQKLAELTNINKGNISGYMNSKYEPKIEAIEVIAKALNISAVWLMGYDVPMEHIQPTNDLKHELKDVKFAFYDETKDFTDAQLNDLKTFIDYLKIKG